ncbi:hypothetical protein GQ55_8G031900 [Panicum hallii var. hallii]|uniref:Uncharacterized protein n=3 Tax=Panicum hallii TaxID=206008 RepID=A0A2T7CK87_9POAL|nr:hypothetical protein PAHAL_8G033000 [Panicum hallii]PUZ43736.1 hypothetical protein GQ55_8G031900 [Panicum hallii var. hallii]
METMSYPCSPLLSFPIHEESSYSLWSPQLAHHENSPVDPCEFFDTTAIDSSDTHGQNAFDVDVFTHCPERLLCQESGNLATIQEELMEENSLSDLLLTGAEAVEAGDSSLASVVFSKLDELLPVTFENAAASSFDRLAYHFSQGLQSRMSGASSPCYPPEPEQSGTMSVHQMIQELSPFVKFTHFTANQAILDATTGDTDVHVIDFNLSEGIQWSSLMSDLARQGGKSFHLTAIIMDADHNNNTHHTAARCLAEFAESLNLPFQFSFLCIHNKEDLEDFSRNREGSVVFSCDTTNLCYKSWSKLQMLLLGCVKNLQPKLVVIIEEELVRIGKEVSLSHASFVEFFFEALHHFTMVFESLVSCFSTSNNRVCLKLVERDMVGPKIQDFVGQYRSVTLEVAAPKDLERFVPCGLSARNIAQARMLVGLFNRSFGITHEKGRLQLCWKSRPLISVSVWTPL